MATARSGTDHRGPGDPARSHRDRAFSEGGFRIDEAAQNDAAHGDICRAFRDEVLDWLVATSDVIPLPRDPRMEPALFDEFLGTTRSPYPIAP